MSSFKEQKLYEYWVKAWNEDSDILDEITARDCHVHQARTDGESSMDTQGPEALKGIIRDACAFFNDVEMKVEVGPIIDESYLSARWKFTGTYNGEMPGAKARSGEAVAFNGMDIFLIENGKFKEYWVSSDGIDLMKQLQIME